MGPLLEKLAIRDVIDNWVSWRDAGQFDRLRTTFHPDARFTATWFDGPFSQFVEASTAAWRRGSKSIHFLGGTTIDVVGNRAVAQTKMQIMVRAMVEGVEADAVCNGRFYDRFEKRDGEWRIAIRSCIYEKSRIDPVEPGAKLVLDQALLDSFPEGYRHLVYIQAKNGASITPNLATSRGPEIERLYELGRQWLDGK